MQDNDFYFIHILCDFLNYRKSSPCPVEEYPSVVRYGELHDMLPVVHYQLKTKDTDEAYLGQLALYAKYRAELRSIEAWFSDIPYALEKGIVMAELYPVPALRTMGDMDILVPDGYRETAKHILCSHGYSCKRSYGDEWKFCKQEITVEMHSLPMHHWIGNERYVEYFSDWSAHVSGHRLEDNYHILYLLVHLRQHFVGSGVGIRQFMDIALATRKLDLDWVWILREAETLRVDGFVKTVLALNERWFDVPSPFPLALSEEFVRTATERILENGVFGFASRENRANDAPRLAVNRQISIKKAKRQLWLDAVFPSYNMFLWRSDCPDYLKKSAMLLPVAWLAHCLRMLKKPTSIARSVNTMKETGSSAEDRLEYFKQWGL